MNVHELWKQRFGLFLKEARTYGKYIFNDHLKFILIFAIGVGAYYYQQWLATLSPSFPAAFVLAVVLALALTAGTVQTLLKPADLVFLLPLEEQLKPYFAKAFRFTYLLQLYVLAMLAAAGAPLYLQVLKGSGQSYLLIVAAAALMKLWNLFAAWEAVYSMSSRTRLLDRLARLCLNALLLYVLLSRASAVYAAVLVVIMAAYGFFLYKGNRGRGLNWEQLIAEENKRMLLFYRVANLFTDVPALKEQVHRRRWLDPLAGLVSFSQQNSYSYLYVRTFLRAGGYFGLYIRLLVLGGILIYVIPFLYGRFILGVLFLYLIGYQSLTLWKHHRYKLWLDLYPVPAERRNAALLQLLFAVMAAASVAFAVTFLAATAAVTDAALLLIIGLLFSYVFTYIYIKNRTNKADLV
ncbi:ABC transporter permease [Ectobacillus ponti]|uniref:ABC transporter permease n=1 Tax=Ectobacillus ponti TaxID=2961894 RepID=A0AA41X8F6_9BACI|nr:ABC transporter permease [Ectobacillus ponti]MCP8968213.1 ABC transporter permease [Ectobacillus ponti]